MEKTVTYLRGYYQGYMNKEAAEGQPDAAADNPETDALITNATEKSKLSPTQMARADYNYKGVQGQKPAKNSMQANNTGLWRAQKKLLSQEMGRSSGTPSPEKSTREEAIMQALLTGKSRKAGLEAANNLDPGVTPVSAENRAPGEVQGPNTDAKRMIDAAGSYDMFRGRLGPDASQEAMGGRKGLIQEMIKKGLIMANKKGPATGNVVG